MELRIIQGIGTEEKRSGKLHLKKWDFLTRSIEEILTSNKPRQLSRIPAVPPQHSTAAGLKQFCFQLRPAPNKLSVSESCWGGGREWGKFAGIITQQTSTTDKVTSKGDKLSNSSAKEKPGATGGSFLGDGNSEKYKLED